MGRTLPILALAALASAGVACSESTVPAGPARHLTLLGGGGQSGPATGALPELLVVRVTDDAGLPVTSVAVNWNSPDPGGHFIPAANRTDADGVARARWVLGVRSGPQSAQARVEGWDDRLAVTASATPGLKAVALMRGDPSTHMCAIDADARSWCWSSGSLDGGAAVRQAPGGGHRFRTLVGGYYTSCGITEADELWCWDVGSWYSGPTEAVPARVGEDILFRSVDIEYPMVCGVSRSNDGYCWGNGVLGDGQPGRASEMPVLVAGGHAWREIAPSALSACGVDLAGTVFCWASVNTLGHLALHGPGPFLTPAPVSIVANISSLTSNENEHCGLVGGGTSALCWGWPGYIPPASAVSYDPVPGLAVHRVSATFRRTAVLDSRGTIWAWGDILACCHVQFDGPTPLPPEGVWSDVSATTDGVYAILAADSTVHVWRVRQWPDYSKDNRDDYELQWPYPAAIPAPSP